MLQTTVHGPHSFHCAGSAALTNVITATFDYQSGMLQHEHPSGVELSAPSPLAGQPSAKREDVAQLSHSDSETQPDNAAEPDTAAITLAASQWQVPASEGLAGHFAAQIGPRDQCWPRQPAPKRQLDGPDILGETYFKRSKYSHEQDDARHITFQQRHDPALSASLTHYADQMTLCRRILPINFQEHCNNFTIMACRPRASADRMPQCHC